MVLLRLVKAKREVEQYLLSLLRGLIVDELVRVDLRAFDDRGMCHILVITLLRELQSF